jgi:hypothetical protein
VTTEATGVFLTEAGAEISVRAVQHHSATATTTLEPLYATDLELMDGVTGELRRTAGETLRGTLRRQGNVFVLHPEQPQEMVLEKTETTSPAAPQSARRAKPKAKRPERAPVAPPPPPRAEPNQPTPETAPSQAEAMEALKIVAQFLRAPLASPLPLRAEPNEQAPRTPPSQAEAIEAVTAVAKFLRGDSVEIEVAKQAQTIVSRFIAERDRQMRAREG